MAPAVTETVETKVVVSRISIPTLEDIRFPVEVPMPIRDEQDYLTTSTTNSYYYYQPISATSTSTVTDQTTIVVSKTATITLTTIALITSKSTVTALQSTEAPLLSSTSTNIVLPPRTIAGIVLGALAGLLLFVLIFYLLLTRSEWVAWFSHCCLKGPENIDVEEPERGPRKLTKPAKKSVRKTARARHAGDGKRAGPKSRPISMLVTPEQGRYEEKGKDTST
ncbi:hypothetical protein F4823DRAFT_636601 [Ustulina deusta]|nr:hypothetical protein F4823DRAFT_636601 [Ustulina deusta]